MTWWTVLLVAYGGSFMCGVAAHADGPEPGFVGEWLLFGTFIAAILFITGAAA